ncbi:MAG: hypothetical protein L0170_18285, partial [Acidobacteria bacterium]|nr:hypothetical protein [Acidobacteriota bacterium]
MPKAPEELVRSVEEFIRRQREARESFVGPPQPQSPGRIVLGDPREFQLSPEGERTLRGIDAVGQYTPSGRESVNVEDRRDEPTPTADEHLDMILMGLHKL